MRDYANIKAFQLADDLVLYIYELTKKFPREEVYGLTSQLRRAGVSVPTNIAEGANRQHKREYLHFLYIAKGSLAEVGYLLHLSKRLGYVEEKAFLELHALKEETAKTLYGLIHSVEKETKLPVKLFAFVTSAVVLTASKLLV